MRLCFFGDSFTAGIGDDEGLGWVGRVLLQLRKRGLDVTGYNLGIRRDTSLDIAARWRAEAEARLPVDGERRLVFSFGANDAATDADGAPRMAHDHTLATARQILTEAAILAPVLMIGPLPIADDAAATARIGTLSQALGTLCAAFDTPYLDVFSHAVRSARWSVEARAGDGAHPGAQAYGEIARVIDLWPAWRAFTTPRA